MRTLCSAFLIAASMSANLNAQNLSPETFDRLREQIDVTPDELRWQQVDWLTFWDGLVESQKKDRPIFYWIYFGDPRGGC